MKKKVAPLDKKIEELKREVASHERIKEVMKDEKWEEVRDTITCLDDFIGMEYLHVGYERAITNYLKVAERLMNI